jgi:alpha-methylacyl-CoA racemase
VFLQLAEQTDIVLESFRPGVVDRLGIGYAAVHERHAGIVYCSTSGYGQSGPCASWAGHDINYLALSGFLACSGRDPQQLPAMPGATVADSAGGGMHAAMAIMAALLRRERTGEGSYLDVAATDGVLSLMSLHIDQYLATGQETRSGNSLLTGQFACYGVYATRDGRALSVGAIEPHFFANLCRLLGLEQYSAVQMDETRQTEIRAALQEKFLQHDRDYWVEKLAAHDTCVAPVLEISEVANWPQFRERSLFAAASHEPVGEFEQMGAVLAGSSVPDELHRVAQAGSTDTRNVLDEFGMTAAQIDELIDTGILQ